MKNLILLILILLIGCNDESLLSEKEIRQSNDITEQMSYLCRHEALFIAMVARYQDYPYEMWRGIRNDKLHVKVKVYIDSKWQWVMIYDGMFLTEYDEDVNKRFIPDSNPTTIENYWQLVGAWDK